MNRRQFIQSSVAGLSALSLNAADTPNTKFPTGARDRLAVASYPFRKFLNPKHGTMKLLDFPRMVAERYRVPGIEPLDEHFESTEPAYLEKFRRALDDTKMHAVNLPVGRLGASFWDPDAAKRAIAINNAKRWVDVAVAIGSPNLRAHIQGVKGTPPNAAVAGEALKAVADYGATKNIVIHLENDDPRSEEAYLILDIIAKANTPWLRTLPDFCNSMLIDKGEEYNYKAMADLFQHAYGISHVKDSEQDGKKMYKVDLAKTFAIAQAAGYKGYFSMEFDMDEKIDAYEPTKALVEASLKILS